MTYKEKLSYISGVFDGEGSLFLSKRVKNKRKSWTANISVSMNDIHSLEIIKEVFGGNIRIGHKKIKDIQTKETYCPAYVISYGAEDKVKEIILLLLPYLQVKKEQAVLLLEFLRYKHWKRNGRITPFSAAAQLNNLYIKCKKLKSKNWIIKSKLKL